MAAVAHDPAVFRPSSGPLMLRGNIASGPPSTPKKPCSRGGNTDRASSRFGNLSMNSFFARHNPHPVRVRHIKGLLDIPICAVQDDGYFSNPRYSLQFPPNNFNNQYIKSFSKYYADSNAGGPHQPMPVGSINVNSQTHPTNTISGLNHFLGKSMNMRVFREKAIPKVGLVPVQEAWRDELRALTDAALGGAGDPSGQQQMLQPSQPPVSRGQTGRLSTGRPQTKPRTAGYSAASGRMNENPLRALSKAQRHGTRAGGSRGQLVSRSAPTGIPGFENISEDPDVESLVFQMLCQILQTDDTAAVKAWLVSAGDREKSSVLDMIRTVVANKENYYSHDVPADFVEYKAGELMGTPDPMPPGKSDVLGINLQDKMDKVSVNDEVSDPKIIPGRVSANDITSDDAPALPDVFRPPRSSQSYTMRDKPTTP